MRDALASLMGEGSAGGRATPTTGTATAAAALLELQELRQENELLHGLLRSAVPPGGMGMGVNWAGQHRHRVGSACHPPWLPVTSPFAGGAVVLHGCGGGSSVSSQPKQRLGLHDRQQQHSGRTSHVTRHGRPATSDMMAAQTVGASRLVPPSPLLASPAGTLSCPASPPAASGNCDLRQRRLASPAGGVLSSVSGTGTGNGAGSSLLTTAGLRALVAGGVSFQSNLAQKGHLPDACAAPTCCCTGAACSGDASVRASAGAALRLSGSVSAVRDPYERVGQCMSPPPATEDPALRLGQLMAARSALVRARLAADGGSGS
jgi:hypothetical protein